MYGLRRTRLLQQTSVSLGVAVCGKGVASCGEWSLGYVTATQGATFDLIVVLSYAVCSFHSPISGMVAGLCYGNPGRHVKSADRSVERLSSGEDFWNESSDRPLTSVQRVVFVSFYWALGIPLTCVQRVVYLSVLGSLVGTTQVPKCSHVSSQTRARTVPPYVNGHTPLPPSLFSERFYIPPFIFFTIKYSRLNYLSIWCLPT